MAEKLKAGGAVLVAMFTGALVVWWLGLVAQRLNVQPVVKDGTVILDEFQRAKDILLVVLPLFSATVAYFVGNQGAEKAKEEAKVAKDETQTAKQETAAAKKETTKLRSAHNALLEAAPAEVKDKARQLHPEAFQ
ncbi:MAG: hypothetical protein QOK28_3372 [Actinomycetota bacterium]|jgi:hypothetical protein